MASFLKSISNSIQDFIQQQKMFFVATAGTDTSVNLSPKGLDSFRILDPNTVLWLNYTGSGNETAAHLLEANRMTIMFCSFDKNPLILRLYGTAETYHEGDADWSTYLAHFGPAIGARNIFKMKVERIQTSCGYAVPFYQFEGERTRLKDWSDTKGEEGIRSYWTDKNLLSIDDKPTGMG